MKGILIVAVIILGLVYLGWLKYSDSEATSTIILDKQEAKEDTEKAVEKSKEVLKDVRDKTSEAFDQDDAQSDEQAQPEGESEVVPEVPDEENEVQGFETLKLQPEPKPVEK